MAALWRSRRRQQQALAHGPILFGSGEWKIAQGGAVGGNRGGGEMTMQRINAVGNVWEGVGEPASIAPQKVRKIPRRGCSRWCGW